MKVIMRQNLTLQMRSFLDYSNEMFLYKEYSYDFADEHDYEYDEVSISNDQIMLENISEIQLTFKEYTTGFFASN